MKVTVRIHTAHGLEVKEVKVGAQNKLRLHGGKTPWIATLMDYETRHLRFGRARFFTDISDGANETWQYDQSKGSTIERPELTQEQVTEYAKANIFRRRYQENEKPMPTWLLYAILLVSVGGIVMNYLISTGHLR